MFPRTRWKGCLLLITLAFVCSRPVLGGTDTSADGIRESSPPLDEIVKQLEAKNQQRAADLLGLEGTRVYHMHYEGFFGTRDAEMVVMVKSNQDQREFTIQSQSGSKFIIDHIFKKLLEGEKESLTQDHKRRTALSSENYSFTLADHGDSSSQTPAYVLDVAPKTDEKFLYRGKIWVDPQDFAVTRIEAQPAKSPSMWIKKTQIDHTYEKVEDFWLPAENHTDSLIRFGGHAVLSIEYRDYRITETRSSALAPPR